MNRGPPRSTLLPYTALFRSGRGYTVYLFPVVPAHVPKPHLARARSYGEAEGVAEPIGYDALGVGAADERVVLQDRKSTRLNSSHANISYAVFCLKQKIT